VEHGRDVLDARTAGSSAIRGGALRLAGYGVGLLTSVIAAAVLFRHLGVVDTGRYVLVLSVVTVAAGFTDGGLAMLATRELATRPDDAARTALLRDLLGLRIVLTAGGGLVALGYAALAGYDRVLLLGTVAVGVSVLLQGMQSALAAVLLTRLRLGLLTLADLVRQVVTSAAMIVLALSGARLSLIFWVPAIGALSTLAFTLVAVRGQVPLRPALAARRWRALITDVVPFALAAAVGAIYFRFVIVLVQALSSAHQVGLFGASFRIVEVVIAVPQLVVSSAFPIFARAAHSGSDDERLHHGLRRMLDVCVILGTGIALLLCVGAPVAIAVVGGAHFDGAVAVLRLHAVALLFSCCSAVMGYALLSLRAYRGLLLTNLAALAMSALAAGLLVPHYGARGGALATIAGEATLVFGGAFAVRRARAGLDLRPTAPARVLLAGAVAAAPALVLPALPAAVVAAAIFVVLLVVLRAVPAELIAEARGLTRRGGDVTADHESLCSRTS
jgi:O-antigen/teichoic acid export membrane protein